MKRMKLVSIGLAMALFLTQPAYALITPFGTTATSQQTSTTSQVQVGVAPGSQNVQTNQQTQMGMQAGQQTQPGLQVGQQTQPGMQAGQQTQTGLQVNQQTQAGTQAGQQEGPRNPAEQYAQMQAAQHQNAGPGATSQAAVPSVSYSTKEAVQQLPNGSASGTTVTQTTTQAVNVQKPVVAAESVVLYDVTHNKVLFEKNGDKKMYPASTTKLMTALLVLEKANLDSMVTFSQNAVTKLESGAVTLNLKAGDKVSVKDSLYGLMLKSANEVANGLAEHVGGSISGFADMMNAKAASLGCTGTHFVNPNGLNDSNHYTTAKDMAKIAAAAFSNAKLCEIASTREYTFPATKAAAARKITMGHKMLYPTDSRYYQGIIGGKTGYTSLAGNTLVTCVEKNGVRMIAVVLKSNNTHYADTKAVLDYGYAVEAAGGCTPVQYGPSTHHRWVTEGSAWRFILADGTILSNCFVLIDGVEYAFSTDGKMVTGWKELGGNWHYFETNGSMVKNGWRQDAGKWFYLGSNGAMMKNAWIDNKYYVGQDGIWVQNQ